MLNLICHKRAPHTIGTCSYFNNPQLIQASITKRDISVRTRWSHWPSHVTENSALIQEEYSCSTLVLKLIIIMQALVYLDWRNMNNAMTFLHNTLYCCIVTRMSIHAQDIWPYDYTLWTSILEKREEWMSGSVTDWMDKRMCFDYTCISHQNTNLSRWTSYMYSVHVAVVNTVDAWIFEWEIFWVLHFQEI